MFAEHPGSGRDLAKNNAVFPVPTGFRVSNLLNLWVRLGFGPWAETRRQTLFFMEEKKAKKQKIQQETGILGQNIWECSGFWPRKPEHSEIFQVPDSETQRFPALIRVPDMKSVRSGYCSGFQTQKPKRFGYRSGFWTFKKSSVNSSGEIPFYWPA